MAKNSRYVGSRLATTVNARYYPDEKVIDAYYLDGRFTPNTESRAVRDKSNYEDRGFLFALFAYPAEEGGAVDQTSFANSVQKLNQEIKAGTTSIDSKINDLADCAIDVGGKATLAQEGVRQSYFSGLIVQEGEIAAVTTGAGCAFIYKGNVLYPLTAGEFELEPIDLNGNPVQHLNNYAAGVAGTIRYSNLAQIEADDCLILCNKEVLDILGQREMLRILAESDRQEEAAQNLITAAAAKQSGVSLQVMISLVESVEQTDGRPSPHQASSHQVGATPMAPPPAPQTSRLMQADGQAPARQDTQIYSAQAVNQAMQDAGAQDAYAQQHAPHADQSYNDPYGQSGQDQGYATEGQAPYGEDYAAGASYAQGQDYNAGDNYQQPYGQAPDQTGNYGNYDSQPYADQGYEAPYNPDSYGQDSYGQAYGDDNYQQDYSSENYDQNYGSDYDQPYYNQGEDQYNSQDAYGYDQGQGQGDYAYNDQGTYGYDDQADYGYDQGQGYDDSYYGQDGYYDENGQYPEYQDGYQDQYQDQYYDEYQQNYQDEGYDDYYENQDHDKVKRIVFYVVLAAIILVCVFILVRLLGSGKQTPTPSESPSEEKTTLESNADESKAEASKPSESKKKDESKPSESKDNSESQNNSDEKEPAESGDDQENEEPSDNTGDNEQPSENQGGQANNSQGQTYTVKAGDTFFAILNSYYQSYDPTIQQLVLNANPDITNPDDIRLGQEIILPPAP